MPNKLEEAGISWVIIGSQTKPYRPPAISDVQEIVEAADKAGVAVFLKENLKPLYKTVMPHDDEVYLRQEIPEVR